MKIRLTIEAQDGSYTERRTFDSYITAIVHLQRWEAQTAPRDPFDITIEPWKEPIHPRRLTYWPENETPNDPNGVGADDQEGVG